MSLKISNNYLPVSTTTTHEAGWIFSLIRCHVLYTESPELYFAFTRHVVPVVLLPKHKISSAVQSRKISNARHMWSDIIILPR